MEKHTEHIHTQKLCYDIRYKFCPTINGCLCSASYHMKYGLIDGGTGQGKVFAWLPFSRQRAYVIHSIMAISCVSERIMNSLHSYIHVVHLNPKRMRIFIRKKLRCHVVKNCKSQTWFLDVFISSG